MNTKSPPPAKQRRFRRGSTAQHQNFIGAEGEITYDTDLKALRVQDGLVVGGYVVLQKNADGSVTIGQMNVSPDGKTFTFPGGQSNVRIVNGQMQFYDLARSGWRTFGCVDGVPVFGSDILT